jgi:trimeric autotransporter adhesin
MMKTISSFTRHFGLISVAATFSLVAAALSVPLGASRTFADTVPPAGVPATVSADPLPTWQINGVVWSQVTVGSTVYATGSFSEARPPGTAAGSTSEVAAANIFAFDITTGNRVSTFSHSLNAQGLVIAASPDGSRVYVGGDFTAVDGVSRNHIAAFDTATGALSTTFRPSIAGQVRGIAATGSTVYAAGNFFSVNGIGRTRLAAAAASTGALLSWAPSADNVVRTIVLSPDRTRVIAGGHFTTLNDLAAYGMGSLDAATGATLPWAANQKIRDAGSTGAITSLRADGSTIYGGGYAFGAGSSFEGTFAADPTTGEIRWLNDCHGDTYDAFPIGQVLYSVSHAHDCSAIGQFPETSPRTWHHAQAWTTYATGTNKGPDSYGWNYNGIPDSSLLHWHPTLGIGSYTGQYQAAWSVTGNSSYVVLGGEFPTVNGTAQQGLVRFAVRTIAPNRVGPVASSGLTPTATSQGNGTVRVVWRATWDMDNQTLTYQVLRDGGTTPIHTTTQASSFWQLPSLAFVDTGLAPGSTHTYRIRVVDPLGNGRSSSTSNPVTV